MWLLSLVWVVHTPRVFLLCWLDQATGAQAARKFKMWPEGQSVVLGCLFHLELGQASEEFEISGRPTLSASIQNRAPVLEWQCHMGT